MNDILKLILDSKVIAIVFHTSPDGDAIGSSIALMLGLKTLGKNVYLLSNDEIPNDLKMAFYELIKLRYDRRKQKADLITRVEDNSGTTTSYRDGKTPTHIERIFSYYTGRSFAST